MRPEPVGIIGKSEDEINIKGFGVGDKFANALSQGINQMHSLEKLYIPNNRLSDTGSAKLLECVSDKSLRKMDLG